MFDRHFLEKEEPPNLRWHIAAMNFQITPTSDRLALPNPTATSAREFMCVIYFSCLFLPYSSLFLGRPEPPFRTGLCFNRDVSFSFFFVSPLVLRAPSTDRFETLPHGRNLAEFYNPTSKKWGPKTCKISVNFGPLQILIAISPERLKISASVTNYGNSSCV